MRPSAALIARVDAALTRTRLGAALASRRFVIGMHVRHGDSCNADEMIRARRSCTPLREYMAAARRLLDSRGARGIAGVAGKRATIYLATDSMAVLKEADRDYASEFNILHLGVREVARHNEARDGAALLWDRRVWQRFFWGQTDWTQQQAFDATTELLLLARADAFVGKFSSNLFRAAFSLRAAQVPCASLAHPGPNPRLADLLVPCAALTRPHRRLND